MKKAAVPSILVAAILLAVEVMAQAQQPGKIPRIGFLGNSTAALEENLVEPFRQGLHDLGYVEGKNILIEYRWAEGKYDRFPALIGELVAQRSIQSLPLARRLPSPSEESTVDSTRHDGRRRSHWHGSHREPRAPRRKRHRVDRDCSGLGRKRLELRGRRFPSSPTWRSSGTLPTLFRSSPRRRCRPQPGHSK